MALKEGEWERLHGLGGEEKIALKNCCGNDGAKRGSEVV